MKTSAPLIVVAALMLFGPAFAQTTAPAPTIADIKALAKDLATADGPRRQQLLDQLRALPLAAAPLLETVIADESTPAFARADLQAALPAIRDKARLGRRAKEDQWEASMGMTGARDQYLQVGKKDPRWDALVVAAFNAKTAATPDGFAGFKLAIEAGCDDPLVRYFYALRGTQSGKLPQREAVATLREAAQALQSSQYPLIRRFFGAMRYATLASTTGTAAGITVKDASDALNAVVSLLPDLAREGASRGVWFEVEEQLMLAARNASRDRKEAFDRLGPAFEKALPNSAIPRHLAARFYLEWANDARGGGNPDGAADQGRKAMIERLDKAASEAQAGWKIDPLDPYCAVVMISVCTMRGTDRADMETWYDRAISADPDCYDAANAKLAFVSPRWRGTPEEFLAFARECYENGSPGSRIPLLLATARLELKSYSGDGQAYLASPAVWRDIRSSFLKVIRSDDPRNDNRRLADRALLLKYASDCKQWDDFLELSKEFGDSIDMKTFGGKDLYTYYQKKAATEAARQK